MVVRMATLKKINQMSVRMLGKEKTYTPVLQMESHVDSNRYGESLRNEDSDDHVTQLDQIRISQRNVHTHAYCSTVQKQISIAGHQQMYGKGYGVCTQWSFIQQ